MAAQPSQKYTMVFRLGKYSWTESHYATGPQPPTSQGSQLYAQTLAQSRQACLASPAAIVYVRISTVPASRITFDWYPPNPLVGSFAPPLGVLGAAGVNGNIAALPNEALIVDMYSASGLSTRLYLAGCPAGIFIQPGLNGQGYDLGQVAGYTAALNSYFAFLTNINGTWGWQSRQGAVAFQPALGPPIVNPLYSNSVGITIAGALAPAPNPGDSLQVKGWRRNSNRTPGLTGVYRLNGLPLPGGAPGAPTTTYFLTNTGQVQPGNFYTIGKIGLLNVNFSAYALPDVVGATSRKRGSRIGAPRGRSSIRY